VGIRDNIRAALGAGVEAFFKAEDDDEDEDLAPSGNDLAKPGGLKIPDTATELKEAVDDPKSLFWDPFSVIDALGYKDKPSGVTYSTLNTMLWRMPIIHSIVVTRINQITNFALPQETKFLPGYRVSLRDKKAEATPASEKKSRELEQWLMTTGKTEFPEGRDDFNTFLRKVLRDSLTYDQLCFEVVPDRAGKPAEFYAVDASTIRIADTTKLRFDEKEQDAVRYVQIYDGLVVAEYTQAEMCFGVRNPTSDIRNQNYGQSEIEMLISTVTSLLWAWDYNQKFFSQGTTAKGLINIKGAIPDKQMRAFRRFWYSQVGGGVENAFKQPILNADDLQWISMQQTNKEMEFNAWFDFLIKIATAIFGMDSMEINFRYGDSGGQSVFESANQSKLSASKDKGLKPLLQFLSGKINTHLIQRIDPDFVFEFVGLEVQTPAELADLQTKQIKTYKTVNEIRAEEDMPALPPEEGDVILDPVWAQLKGAQQQMEMQKQYADENGEEDEDDPFGNLENEFGAKNKPENGEQSDDGGDPSKGIDDKVESASNGKNANPFAKKENPFQKSTYDRRSSRVVVDLEL